MPVASGRLIFYLNRVVSVFGSHRCSGACLIVQGLERMIMKVTVEDRSSVKKVMHIEIPEADVTVRWTMLTKP